MLSFYPAVALAFIYSASLEGKSERRTRNIAFEREKRSRDQGREIRLALRRGIRQPDWQWCRGLHRSCQLSLPISAERCAGACRPCLDKKRFAPERERLYWRCIADAPTRTATRRCWRAPF